MSSALSHVGAAPTKRRREHLSYLTDDHVVLDPERVALIGPGSRVTYGELDERADRVAAHLVRRGVLAGDRVGLLWNNHVEYVQTFLGVLRAGATAVPLNIRLGVDALRGTLADASVRRHFFLGRALRSERQNSRQVCPVCDSSPPRQTWWQNPSAGAK